MSAEPDSISFILNGCFCKLTSFCQSQTQVRLEISPKRPALSSPNQHQQLSSSSSSCFNMLSKYQQHSLQAAGGLTPTVCSFVASLACIRSRRLVLARRHTCCFVQASCASCCCSCCTPQPLHSPAQPQHNCTSTSSSGWLIRPAANEHTAVPTVPPATAMAAAIPAANAIQAETAAAALESSGSLPASSDEQALCCQDCWSDIKHSGSSWGYYQTLAHRCEFFCLLSCISAPA